MSLLMQNFFTPILSELTASIKLLASQDASFAESFNEQTMQSLFEAACNKLNQTTITPQPELSAIQEIKEEKLVEIVPSETSIILEEGKVGKTWFPHIIPKKLSIDLREAVFQTLDNYREEQFSIKTLKLRIIEDYCLQQNALAGTKQEIQRYVVEFFTREKYIAEGIEHYVHEHKKLGLEINMVDTQYKVIRQYEEKAKPKQTFLDFVAEEYRVKENQWECPNCLCNVSKTLFICPACDCENPCLPKLEELVSESAEKIDAEEKKPVYKPVQKKKVLATKKEKQEKPKIVKTPADIAILAEKPAKETKEPAKEPAKKQHCAYKECTVQPKIVRILSDGHCYCAKHHKQMEKKLTAV
jgi:hypothetical protein